MKIKKLGHSCLLIEENDKKVLVDPGSYTLEEQNNELGIDIILITHEHPDHFNLESLKKIISNNPIAAVVTNDGVGKLLKEAGIMYEVLQNEVLKDFSGLEIEAYDYKHEELFEEIGQVTNTAFFIAQRLFYPGDSFCNPGKPVEILALPVAGPWTNIKSATQYALEIKPKICFPVHDGMLKAFGSAHRVPGIVLPKADILFKNFEENKEEEF